MAVKLVNMSVSAANPIYTFLKPHSSDCTLLLSIMEPIIKHYRALDVYVCVCVCVSLLLCWFRSILIEILLM